MDINTLKCIALEIILPESGKTAALVGRFSKGLTGPMPEGYHAYVLFRSGSSNETIMSQYNEEITMTPEFKGYVLSLNDIPDTKLIIKHYRLFTA